jgi:hypothetical protein
MSLGAVLDTLNSYTPTARRTQFADTVFSIRAGGDEYALHFNQGKIEEAKSDTAADVVVDIPSASWGEFKRPVPPPGYHDIYAMAENGNATVTGDFLAFFRYSYVLKDVLQQLGKGEMF